eukprot:GHVO01004196.1.p1 GENE.GHVO01004196.1~~GHVO01004196.1.p1  ORF type:complete len:577 (+),score=66.39 GHVO01004196.1:11-1741(+)
MHPLLKWVVAVPVIAIVCLTAMVATAKRHTILTAIRGYKGTNATGGIITACTHGDGGRDDEVGKLFDCPKVYKYELPDWITSRRVRDDAGQADPWDANPYGARVNESQPYLYHTKHKSYGSLLEHGLETYGRMCKTEDPFEADLFFIPWYRDWFCGARPCNWWTKESPEESELFAVIQNISLEKYGENFFRRKYGWDHVITTGNEGAINQVPKDWKYRRGEYTNLTTVTKKYMASITAAHPSSVHFEWSMKEQHFSLPWTATHLQLPRTTEIKSVPKNWEEKKMTATKEGEKIIPGWWQNFQKRRYLVAVAFGSVQGNRAIVKEVCLNSPSCVYMTTDRDAVFHDDHPKAMEDVLQLYGESTFCVHLPGDTCGRKGIIDSIMLGCIPVLFHACGVEIAYDYFNVNRASIVLTKKDLKTFIPTLEGLNPWVIRDKQFYIAANAHRLQFSRVSSTDELYGMPNWAQFLVNEDMFFTTWRVAFRLYNQHQTCEGMGGRYESRYRACCPLSNECDPIALMANGIQNRCEYSHTVPCFFKGAIAHHVDSKADESLDYNEMLWSPQPYKWPALRNQTTETFW